MHKEQPALRILGDRVRHYRKLKGMSQAELAKGICTQATISLIEKRNKVPSMNILVRLVERLGVAMADIVVENRDKTQVVLAKVEQLVRHSDFTQAEQALNGISIDKLTGGDDKKRYYYFKGMIELFAQHAPDEAIYYFGRVLNPLVTRERDLLAIMATLGLGLAYAEKKAQDRARVYIDQALGLLKGMPLKEAKYLDVELTIYWHTARIYYELGDYQDVLKHVGDGIDVAVTHDSLFLLDELYALRAFALQALGDQQAASAYEIAKALARVNQSQALYEQLEKASATA
ncbi:helix-turn-helix domain-containing protein [Lacticaseibacillus baoqingensis]|uniref:Helix-turn-helix domain-containing protein n=1 Tax=Lacticaseibacillus baoqingensis TaxID=2486013 RepID=A0ABW4E4M2_9LACO|nr:helix-turn-helix transcriptional regulator [Lacticaseibacillus baoqingensis]